MIQIKIDVLPKGKEFGRYNIASAMIINQGTGTRTKGNYTYSLRYKGRSYRTGEIEGFPRERKNTWYLLLRCLMEALDGD